MEYRTFETFTKTFMEDKEQGRLLWNLGIWEEAQESTGN